jgi:hypothetical protein
LLRFRIFFFRLKSVPRSFAVSSPFRRVLRSFAVSPLLLLRFCVSLFQICESQAKLGHGDVLLLAGVN